MKSQGKVFWIAVYTHRHGVDVWPMFQKNEPTEAQMIKHIEPDWEPEREEYLEARGPFKVTQ